MSCFSTICMYVHVHGARCLDYLMYSSVLFTGRRVGDVTVWYQSSCCSMGLSGPWRCSNRSRISFCSTEIRSWWQKNSTNLSKCLNCWFIKTLHGKDFRCSGELSGSILDKGHLEGKLWKNFLSVRRSLVESSWMSTCHCGWLDNYASDR